MSCPEDEVDTGGFVTSYDDDGIITIDAKIAGQPIGTLRSNTHGDSGLICDPVTREITAQPAKGPGTPFSEVLEGTTLDVTQTIFYEEDFETGAETVTEVPAAFRTTPFSLVVANPDVSYQRAPVGVFTLWINYVVQAGSQPDLPFVLVTDGNGGATGYTAQAVHAPLTMNLVDGVTTSTGMSFATGLSPLAATSGEYRFSFRLGVWQGGARSLDIIDWQMAIKGLLL